MLVYGIRLTLKPGATTPVGAISLLRPNDRGKYEPDYMCNAAEVPDSLHGPPFSPLTVLQFDPARDVWTAPEGVDKLLLIVNQETHRLHPVRPRPESWPGAPVTKPVKNPAHQPKAVHVVTPAPDPDVVVELGPQDSSITADTEIVYVDPQVNLALPHDPSPIPAEIAAALSEQLPPITTGDADWGPGDDGDESSPIVKPVKPEDAGA